MSDGTFRFELDDGVDGGAQLQVVVPMLGAVIASVRPDDMDRPTPCDAWTLRNLLNHIIGGAMIVAVVLDQGGTKLLARRIARAGSAGPSKSNPQASVVES